MKFNIKDGMKPTEVDVDLKYQTTKMVDVNDYSKLCAPIDLADNKCVK